MRPQLPFLETMITQVCNLSCHGCTNFSDLTHSGYVSWNQGKQWVESWIEHIDILAVENILSTTLHYLTPGAHIRILVPDFKVYTREHSRGEVTPQGFVSRTLSLNRLFYHWGHIFMYDFQILEDLLLNVGYVNVKHVQWGDGPLGQFDSKERQYESLCVIAEKP
jgi:hypothetical protein